MKRIQSITMAFGAVILAGALFTACKKSNFENNNPDVAGLMSFNLARDRAVVLGLSGSALTNQALAFTNYTGGYMSIYPGNRTFESYDYASGDSLAQTPYNFEAKKYYSAFVVGVDGNYQNIIVNDNIDSLSGSNGKSYVRYVNAIPGSTNASVTITSGGTPVASNAGFTTVSSFTEVAPGDVTIAVTEGSETSASRTITVEQRKVYTVLLLQGTNSTDPAQIKFVVNGTLDEDASGQRVSSSAQSVNVK